MIRKEVKNVDTPSGYAGPREEPVCVLGSSQRNRYVQPIQSQCHMYVRRAVAAVPCSLSCSYLSSARHSNATAKPNIHHPDYCFPLIDTDTPSCGIVESMTTHLNQSVLNAGRRSRNSRHPCYPRGCVLPCARYVVVLHGGACGVRLSVLAYQFS